MTTIELKEQQREHFNRVAGLYRQARSNPNHLTLKKLLWEHALSGVEMPGKKKPRVLEAMCGFADGHEILSRRYRELDYSGFDYSEEIVNYLAENRPDLDIWHQDVTCFSAERGYDAVVLLGGLHHVPDHCQAVVTRLADSLCKGGVFVSLEPTHGNAVFRHIREHIYRKNDLFDENSERAFDPGELAQMFRNAGLEEEKTLYPGLLSYVLYYNPDAFPQLNIGSSRLVSILWGLEKPFMGTLLARLLSFATLSIWRKP